LWIKILTFVKKKMSDNKKEQVVVKSVLHQRNKHRDRYDFKQLIAACPELEKYLKSNIHSDQTIDFANPKAVKWLNYALLKTYYAIQNWTIPTGYLCPPIPSRADYLHYIADLLATSNYGKTPVGNTVKCMDIGVGASCIYPIIGNKEYNWSFIGSDIDPVALQSANKIIENNSFLVKNIELRLQENPNDIFHGIMNRSEPIDFTICNPPFHASQEDALQSTLKKISSLKKKKATEPVQNFGGQSNELWCNGGELRFIRDMIRQSKQFSTNCFWYTTLVSKQSHLAAIHDAITSAGAFQAKTINMGQGNKVSRIVAWSFLNSAQQKKWRDTRWNALK